jgi:hypothetical protein
LMGLGDCSLRSQGVSRQGVLTGKSREPQASKSPKFDFIHLCRSRGVGQGIGQARKQGLRNFDHVGFLG